MRRDQYSATWRDSTEVEVISRLSELFPFIEERQESLIKPLNKADADTDADDEDEDMEELALEEMRT